MTQRDNDHYNVNTSKETLKSSGQLLGVSTTEASNKGVPIGLSISVSNKTAVGEPIDIHVKGNGVHYDECDKLDDLDLVARVIYGEICNVPPYKDNASAVAQVIKNRVIYSFNGCKTVREVVLGKWQFGCVFDGNGQFAKPPKESKVWDYCVDLAEQLTSKENISECNIDIIINIQNSQFFYHIDPKKPDKNIPLYICSNPGKYDRCTTTDVSKATHYKYPGGKYCNAKRLIIIGFPNRGSYHVYW